MNPPSHLSAHRALLWSGFLASAERFPGRPALEVEGKVLTYEQLRAHAMSIAATLARHAPGNEPPLTAVFAYRSVTAFAGVLGTLLRGHGYVPLNRTFPVDRTRVMLERSECSAMVVDEPSARQLDALLEGITKPLLLVLPESDDVSEMARRFPRHRVLGKNELEPAAQAEPQPVDPGNIAYLLFTSGSTGVPKGVMVSHANARHYIEWTVQRYQLKETDRCSQSFDMTFDLSVHDMFVTWERGACLCCPTQKQLIQPGGFILDSKLTTWFSVPSTAVFMRRLGMLKPGKYPGLRLSLFCGEALPLESAKAWAEAAPNSVVENIYGPTELTIACTAYRWNPSQSPAECEQGVVPIGEPFADMQALIVDENLRPTAAGEPGELLMSGPQTALGYWRDPEKTAKAFVAVPGREGRFYRTGDRVRRAAADKPLVYLGRMDNQVKVLGHRVELGEIEAVLREESGIESVAALGWPMDASGASGIEAFVQASEIDAPRLIDRIRVRLPLYMVPRRIHALPVFPLNANGKIDRKALAGKLSS